jgi:hypothetical protein
MNFRQEHWRPCGWTLKQQLMGGMAQEAVPVSKRPLHAISVKSRYGWIIWGRVGGLTDSVAGTIHGVIGDVATSSCRNCTLKMRRAGCLPVLQPPDAFYVVGVPLLRRLETAVRSWAGANGLANMMLFGTPFEVQSAAAAPLI